MQRHGLILLVSVSAALGQSVSFRPPFAVPGPWNLRSGFLEKSLATGDLNGDGKADLVVITPPDALRNSVISVYLGNGDGTFRLTQPQGSAILTPAFSPVLADFNGDKKLDLVLTEASTVVFLPGNGDGTFGTPIVTQAALPNSSTGLLPVIAVDFNRDGRPDVIAGQNVLAGNGDGTFRTLSALESPALLAADFNNDGNADLLLAPVPGQLALALGRGDGTFAKAVALSTPVAAASVVSGDFNGDGRMDLAISANAAAVTNAPQGTAPIPQIAVLRGNGDGTFQTPLMTGNATGPVLAAADMNGDGKLDLIIGNSVLAGVGDGTFRFPVFFGVATNSCSVTPGGCQVNTAFNAVVTDVNGDGAPDVVEAYSAWAPVGGLSEPGLSVLLNNSPGDGFLVTGVSSASYKWPTGAVSQATAFGKNMAPTMETAADLTAPPTTLGGIRVHLRDRTLQSDGTPTPERLAPLFYVAPDQINFEISTTDTSVFIAIERVGSPFVAKGMIIPVQPIAPDLYTLNSSGLAAASALRVSPSGAQEPVATAAPIDVSGNPVYLSLYGTGFDSPAPRTDMFCTVGGLSVTPSYAGRQLQIPGLDQINLLLPASLSGRGDVAIQCTVGSGSDAPFTGVVHVTVK